MINQIRVKVDPARAFPRSALTRIHSFKIKFGEVIQVSLLDSIFLEDSRGFNIMLRETVIKAVATREMDSRFHGCLGGFESNACKAT